MPKNNLTLHNGVTAGADAGYGGSLVLDGTSGYGVVAGPVANAMAAGSPFTVAARFKLTSSSAFGPIYAATSTTSNGTANVVFAVNSGVLTGYVAGFHGNANLAATGAGGSCNDGNWHLGELSAGPAGLLLFLDGALVASSAGGSYSPTTTGTLIESVGAYFTDTSGTAAGYFAGSVSKVQVYSAQLHAASYAAPTSPTPNTDAGLVTYYRCDAGTINGGTVLDCAQASISLSPAGGASGQAVVVTGVNTQWNTIAPTFSIAGPGNTLNGSAHSGDTAGGFTVGTVTTSGSQVVTDPTSGATAAFSLTPAGVTPPGAPTLSTPSPSGSNLTIAYAAPARGTNNVTAVSLYQGSSAGGEGAAAVATNNGGGSGSFTVPAPAAGSSAYFTARATDGSTVSAASNEVSYTTPVPPSLSVSGPSSGAVNAASGVFTLSISAAQPSATAVAVAHSASGFATNPATPTIAAGQSSTTFTVLGTTPGLDTLTFAATGITGTVAAFAALSSTATTIPVIAPYHGNAGLASAIGFTVYGASGVLLPRTTGATVECGAGSGIYLCTVPVELAWSGIVVVDAPAGLVPAVQAFAGMPTPATADPWATTLPGAYAAGTAGRIVGTYLDAHVSGPVTVGTVNDKAGYSLSATGLDAAKGWGNLSLRQTIQGLYQFLIGNRAGVPVAGSAGTVSYRDNAGNSYGTVTVDTAGNIIASNLTPPA